VTYLELRITDAHAFTALAVEFRFVADRLLGRAETIAGLRVGLERDWSGAAAQAALGRRDRLHQRVVEAAALASRCDQVLAELGGRLSRALALLTEAEELAEAVGLSIDTDGRAGLGTAGAAPDPGQVQVAVDVDRRVTAALRLAGEADEMTAGGLRELAVRLSHEPTGPFTLGPSTLGPDADGLAWPGELAWPDPSASPAEVAAFWAGLSGPQRWWLVTHQSAMVGGRDGIAVADRDLANRLLLESERERLLALRADGDVSGPLVEIAWTDGQLRGIGAIEARLRDPALPRAYLLELSTLDDGRAVIAVGNPDQASDVLTYIPGAGSDLSGVDTLVRRADTLGEAAARVAPQRQVSVIAWLGYDPPDGVGAVMAQAGHDAEPALNVFADGLRATHDGERSHNTVLGHSYGSLVAGVTARDRGLDADDLVFVGSPGVGVDRAADLGLSPRDVWSSTAANDPVQRFAPGWGQFVLNAAANAAALLPMHFYGDATPDLLLWHGLNPSAPAFGGNVFASDPEGGHNGYWQGAALTNIARIALNLDPAT
jgi:hypothetical protein